MIVRELRLENKYLNLSRHRWGSVKYGIPFTCFLLFTCTSYEAFKDTAVCCYKAFYKSKVLLTAQLAAQIASFGICLEFLNELDVGDFLDFSFFIIVLCRT